MPGYNLQDNLNMLERYMALELVSTSTFECLSELTQRTSYGLSPEEKRKVLNFFVKNANNQHLANSDLLPSFIEACADAFGNDDENDGLDLKEKSTYAKALFHKNKKFMLKAVPQILQKDPSLAETFYGCMGDFPENSPNDAPRYCNALKAIYLAAEPELALDLLQDIYENPKNEELQHSFAPHLSELYNAPDKTALQSYIFALMKRNDARVTRYYSNLKTALEQGEDPREILDCIDRGIESAAEIGGLLIAYDMLGKDIPEKAPELKQRGLDIIKRSLENNKNNTKTTIMRANVYLERWEELRGGAIIGQRVPKSEKYPLAWKADICIDEEKPCILCLCGDGTKDEKSANGYAKEVEKILESKGLKGKADIYAAAYDFGYNSGEYLLGSDSGRSRSQMFKDYKHLRKIKGYIQPTKEDKNPKYVQDLYEKFLLPRISKNKGTERIDFMEARKNIRNLQIVAHCHGAYTALKMEELMQKKMQELGYSKGEREAIQKELLIVAQSPYCPLGVSKSTFISFCSAKDGELNHHNYFNDSVWEINQESNIKLSYFDEKKGNLFLVSDTGIGEYAPDQHNYWGLEPHEGLSKDMKSMIRMEENAIINGVKNALEGRRGLPSVRDLVCDGFGDKMQFNEIARNGEELYGRIVERSKKRAKSAQIVKKYGEAEY